MSLRSTLWRMRQTAYETMGNPKYSRPALYDLDAKLGKYLNFKNGFFIEAGANDGFTQSNTYYLEKFLGWRGIMVEGIPQLFEKAQSRRPGARVFNCALVPFGQENTEIEMVYGNLMSVVTGAQKSSEEEADHIETAKQFDPAAGSFKVKVRGRTLTSLLDECAIRKIDFLSLDVEGFEAPVLQGIDFERHRPTYLCIEARYRADIEKVISPYYDAVEDLTEMDVLYRSKDGKK